MMKPVFDDNGLAIEEGNIRCFYYCPTTGEYTGCSDEYIYVGVSMPGNSTDIEPGKYIAERGISVQWCWLATGGRSSRCNRLFAG